MRTALAIALRGGAAVLLLSLGALGARAQAERDAPHPAHIHSGSCADLGDIVYPLDDVALATAGEAFGAADAIPVEESETEIDASLSSMLAAPHAINIHQSADAIQIYIACGDIGGRVVDGDLVIGLSELSGSGHNGIAVLDGSDEDETEVTVYLAKEGATADEAAAPAAASDTTPAAAPAQATAEPTAAPAAAATSAPAAAATGQDVPVDIRDFAYSPNSVTIAVGDTVTWTNQDEVPHTVTGQDSGVLQSGTISPGSSFSQVFDTAGEISYHCEFHPNMNGTVIVQ
jgi:plastocyanin